APAALSKNIVTASSLDSYDSAVEDAQRREPKRVKETFVTPKKPLPADAAEALSEPKPCPRPSKAAKLNAPPADVGCPKPTTDRSPKPTTDRSPKPTTDRSPKPTGVRSPKPTTGPTRLNSQDSSPGPSASDVAPPGEQLRELLKKHGNFKSLEMNLRKFHLKKKILAKRSSYVTKAYLLGHCHWPMVEKAWVWANEHKVLRKNEVHGEEEAKLILSEDFDLLDEEGQEISMNGSVEMEVPRLRC
ncbi:unnamed protein product, partial [Symbiodinium necroappetens]